MKTRMRVKNDFIFQRIFGRPENKNILKDLLMAILGIEIEYISIIADTKLSKDKIDDKLEIVDIRAELNNKTQINIEVQLLNQKNMDKRTLYYWSKLYTGQLKEGDSFNQLNKTITINILDFEYLPDENYHVSGHIYSDTNKELIITDQLEIHFLELSKFRKSVKNINNKLEAWLAFIDGERKEMVELATKLSPQIVEATKVLDYLSGDEETIRLYELRQKAIMDEINIRESGKIEGRIEEKVEITKTLLIGGYDVEEIQRITKLSIDEIDRIKKEV